MTFINYDEGKDKVALQNFLQQAEWKAGQHLYELLQKDQFKTQYGQKAKLYFYQEEDQLLGFGALVEQDYLDRPNLTPWIALIYVDPKARGKRLSQKIVHFLEEQAFQLGYNQVYLVSQHQGLYEKYGYDLMEVVLDSIHDKDYLYQKQLN